MVELIDDKEVFVEAQEFPEDEDSDEYDEADIAQPMNMRRFQS